MTIRFFQPVVLLIFLASGARADSKDRIMASRYLRAQFCVERAVGQRWHERYDIPVVMNRWGVSEPTVSGLAKAPEALRRAHTRCRLENEIANEPIPG
ncbi:hypothetical protein QTI51_24720 [Variovorax sp. J22G73]|uniref:hypothetical protein n=1 Tax=unclassified Variovorax TaxID=663243 RepID=UPI002578C629|nr:MULTISPECIES: hypothetical protein [unclassified Variovorax]MDM0007873.1 hypothetical protein [Variovorax sp. J22R203]MDM0100504.1 hypothetical protein [Variovorax sp. J22G73]